MKTFQELNLIPPLHRALADENYTIPTPIQAQTIPAALDGEDILGCAQTGTGKTAAFALPILNRLGERTRKAKPNRPLALVLAPTRELAIQIGESFATYGRHLPLRHVLVYGGVKQGNQVRALARGAHVLVATPGRLLDLMNQGYIDLEDLEVFVLDEADRMLDMGFLPDLKRIISQLPEERQSLFFSATLPANIVQLSQRLLYEPVSVNVTPKTTSVKRIEQRVLFVEKTGKQALLREIVSSADVDRVIVFTRTKRGANVVADKLLRTGIQAVAIHGNKSQNARQRALEDFRQKRVRVLVATDVAARGIDIDGVTHVINFDLPIEPEAYVHRIGRTGRAGADGIALSFCSSAERKELRAIEQLIGHKVPLAVGQKTPPELPDLQPPASSRRGRSSGSASRSPSSGPRRTGSGRRRSTAIIGAADPVPKPKARRRRRPQQSR
ncbi:MAG: DEAD/DEAH box helicase [Planctomycetaceae bacterium]